MMTYTFYVKFLLTIAKLLRAIGNIANKTCDRILTYLENLLDEMDTRD